MSTPSAPAAQFDLPEASDRQGIGKALSDYWDRVKGGDTGALPATIGIIVLVAIFGISQGDTFLSTNNFANLLNQGAAIIVLAMGLVFVLLLGEIDLSAGFTAGICAAILGVTLTNHGWAWPLSVLAALLAGVAIGFAIAVLVARLGIPSFVVTLAFFLALQGAILLVIGEGGTIPIRSDAVLAVMNKNMPVALGWLFAIIVVGGYAGLSFLAISRRKKAGLPAQSMAVWGAKVGVLGVFGFVALLLLNQERQRSTAIITIQGVPWVVPLVALLVVILSFLLLR